MRAFLCNVLTVLAKNSACEWLVNGSSSSLVQVRVLLQGFLLFLFLQQTIVALLWGWAVEDFTTLGRLDLKKAFHHSSDTQDPHL